jgi:hypothetical protein
MAKYEVLSTAADHKFPERLFEIMPDDHFWVRWRFAVFLQETQKLQINLTDRSSGLISVAPTAWCSGSSRRFLRGLPMDAISALRASPRIQATAVACFIITFSIDA